jgi:hypothetical protein
MLASHKKSQKTLFFAAQNLLFCRYSLYLNFGKDTLMSWAEKRKHTRLPLQLDLLCQPIGMECNRLYVGKTQNISTGGVSFRLADSKISRDDLVNVEFTLPPQEGLLEFGGRVSTFARVVRVSPSVVNSHHTVAARFLQFPKLVE